MSDSFDEMKNEEKDALISDEFFKTNIHEKKNTKDFIYCTECGNILDKNAAFCPTCGKNFMDLQEEDNADCPKEEQSDTKKCPFCGETIKAVAKKCRFCNKWLTEEPINNQADSISSLRKSNFDDTNKEEKIMNSEGNNEKTKDLANITKYKICNKCGNNCSLDALFCNKCGNNLVEKELKCSNCGAKIENDDTFCSQCGTKIVEENANSQVDITPEENIEGEQQVKSDTKQCPFCGETIKSVAKKCRFCDKWLDEDNSHSIQNVETTKKCQFCGTENKKEEFFCHNCGKSLSPNPQQAISDQESTQTQYNSPRPNSNYNYQQFGSIPNIDKFNWGAFTFTWIWGLCNGSYLILWILVPMLADYFIPSSNAVGKVINGVIILFCCIVCGVKGNELAWRNKKWKNVEHFDEVQKNWAIASAMAFIILVIIILSVVSETY